MATTGHNPYVVYTDGTSSGTAGWGSTVTSTSSYLEIHQQEMQQRMLDMAHRAGRDEAMRQMEDRDLRPSPNHVWSEYAQRWVLQQEDDHIHNNKLVKRSNPLTFFEKIQEEVDEWLSDVELAI